jgi:Zn-dependent peptidase ImmA (M78 family)
MRRGFKAQAERSAAIARNALGVAENAPIDPWAYAEHLGVRILSLYDLGLSEKDIQQLTTIDGESWSAMTLQLDGKFAVVVNPAQAITRQRNDLMHELAHVELEHTPVRVEASGSGLLLLSDYSEEQEQEADWLAAALLLPREGLVRLRSARLSAIDIANHYGVSQALCEWRLRMTGVDVQMRRAFF